MIANSLRLRQSRFFSSSCNKKLKKIGSCSLYQGHGHAQKRSFSNDVNHVFSVVESDFEEKVMKSKVPVVLDCYADWCGPCKQLGPILEDAVNAKGGKVVMAKLDTDSNPGLAQQLQVRSLPTVMGIYEGKLESYFVGAQQKEYVEGFVDELIEKTTK